MATARGSIADRRVPWPHGGPPGYQRGRAPVLLECGLAAGSLGGIGWRPDAEHIILLATDTQPVAAFSASPIPATVSGLGGATVPSTAFESTAETVLRLRQHGR